MADPIPRPNATLARLFVDQPLESGAPVTLEGPAAHYLAGVMRLDVGARALLFDDRSGEYLAEVVEAGRRRLTLRLVEQSRPRERVPDLWLCAAPLKKGRIDWLAEKACELGVARLLPVITRRTVVDRPKLDRLRAHMIEAAEQCGRTALPELAEAVTLPALLRDWPDGRALLFADEEGGAPFPEAARAAPPPAAILIGPEGGFDAEERASIRAHPAARAVGMGPRILRADTAAAAAVALWQAASGDWY
jgi:16S rRNA (uracil1498-N3)-methyltransferase